MTLPTHFCALGYKYHHSSSDWCPAQAPEAPAEAAGQAEVAAQGVL